MLSESVRRVQFHYEELISLLSFSLFFVIFVCYVFIMCQCLPSLYQQIWCVSYFCSSWLMLWICHVCCLYIPDATYIEMILLLYFKLKMITSKCCICQTVQFWHLQNFVVICISEIKLQQNKFCNKFELQGKTQWNGPLLQFYSVIMST